MVDEVAITNPYLEPVLHNARIQACLKARTACERAQEKYAKLSEAAIALRDKGSGKVRVWTPPM